MLSNIPVLLSYLSGIYLESWFSWLKGRFQKTLKKRRKPAEEKYWKMKRNKNKKYRESLITRINTFGFTFHIKNIIVQKHSLKKKSLYHHNLFTVILCVAGYLKHSHDTAKLKWFALVSFVFVFFLFFFFLFFVFSFWAKD